MLRFTDAMLNNKELQEKIGFHEREEEYMRKFFLDRVQEESVLSGQSFLYLHYADMIANGYHRTMPCPFRSQGLLLNPYGDLHYCENSDAIGNVLTTPAEELYFKAENLAHREHVKDTICPTCLSPCQVNVGAMKQFVPYAKFLVRAYQVKHRSVAAPRDAPPARSLESGPAARPHRGRGGAHRRHSLEESSRDVLAAAAGADWRLIGVAVVLVLFDRALMAYPLGRAPLHRSIPPSVRPLTAIMRIFLPEHVRRHVLCRQAWVAMPCAPTASRSSTCRAVMRWRRSSWTGCSGSRRSW